MGEVSLVVVLCEICAKPFEAKVADIERGWAKCCCKSHAAKYRERILREKAK